MLARNPISPNRNWLVPNLALHREMDRLFDGVLRRFDLPAAFDAPAAPGAMGPARPRMNVVDGEHDVQVTAELPGLDEKDIEVTLADGVLAIRGERAKESEDSPDDGRYRLRERRFGAFERALRIDVPVEEDAVRASFANGVLRVVLPKTEEAKPKVRRIPIAS